MTQRTRPPAHPTARAGARTGARCLALGLSLVAATFGCDGAPQGITDAVLYEVWISSPHAADQAFHLTFNDRVEAFDPTPHIQHFHGPAHDTTTLVLVAYWPTAAGETLVGTARIRARDPTILPTARMVEVARSDFQLRDTLASYRVRLTPR